MLHHTKLPVKDTIVNDVKDKMAIRKYLGILRNDKRKSSSDNVFRLSTILPNGMSYAEFALYYTRRNKNTITCPDGNTPTKDFKPRLKRSVVFTDADLAPYIPETRKMKKQSSMLSDCFRDVVGDPDKVGIGDACNLKNVSLNSPNVIPCVPCDVTENKVNAGDIYVSTKYTTSKKRTRANAINMSNILQTILVKKRKTKEIQVQ